MSEDHSQLSLVQRSDLTRDNWEIIQEQIEYLEKHGHPDPIVLAELLKQRDAIEKSLWEIEFRITLDLLLTHEAMTELKPFIESAFAAGIRAGITDSFEHFLIVALAGPDGIRPTIPTLAEAQEAIADRLGILV